METKLQKLEERVEKIKKIREKMDTLEFHQQNIEKNLPNPFEIAQTFISEKGLKLYGGEALHELLDKYNKGIYTSVQLPDYDVFSPNAYEHAKELANKYHKMGYSFVEVKPSVLNDKTHQTYKVGVNFTYMLDITQIGCTTSKFRQNKCNDCASHHGKCLDIFNEIPAVDINSYKPENKDKNQIKKKIYDYKTDKSIFPEGLFVTSPDWLKISLYYERSVPMGDPSRIEKIEKRSKLFTDYFELENTLCDFSSESNKNKAKEINKIVVPILNRCKYILKKNNAIHYGLNSLLFFTKNSSVENKTIYPMSFRVYHQNSEKLAEDLFNFLRKKYTKETFKLQTKHQYWKGADYHNTSILLRIKNKYYELIRVTKTEHCMPYVRYNETKYATIDRMKYVLYQSLAFQDIIKEVDNDTLQYACLLSSLIQSEKEYYEKHKDKNEYDTKHKFRRYVLQCEGNEVNKIVKNLQKRNKENAGALRKSIYLPNFPEKHYITKIEPLEKENKERGYKPFMKELEKKQNRETKKTLKKIYKKKIKKYTNKKKKSQENLFFTKQRFLGFL